MDRLRVLSGLLTLLATACDTPATDTTVPSARQVDAVTAKPITARDLDGFCDLRPAPRPHDDGTAPPSAPLTLRWPTLDHPAPRPSTPMWVNVWATWCEPCVEEMPRVMRFGRELGREGHPVALFFISVDESAEAVAGFLKDHPDLPAGARLTEPKELESWLTHLGLGTTAAIPIQVFTDAAQNIRCVRGGGVADHHLDIVRALVSP
jgi:thiol-disulfide isomerase/thioredoxin